MRSCAPGPVPSVRWGCRGDTLLSPFFSPLQRPAPHGHHPLPVSGGVSWGCLAELMRLGWCSAGEGEPGAEQWVYSWRELVNLL